jgi:hypothetical protein
VFSDLPELHALSSGLKATCTAITADGIEAARRTCGGHGYSQLSGLPRLFASYVQNVTWEGDNNVLYLQVCCCVCSCACKECMCTAALLRLGCAKDACRMGRIVMPQFLAGR